MKSWNLTHLSIRLRLPLFICILLLIIILVFGWISYFGVRRASLQVGEDRLVTLTENLRSMFSTSMSTSSTAMQTAVNNPAIKKYLHSGGKDSKTESAQVLKELIQDSLYVKAELLNARCMQVLN